MLHIIKATQLEQQVARLQASAHLLQSLNTPPWAVLNQFHQQYTASTKNKYTASTLQVVCKYQVHTLAVKHLLAGAKMDRAGAMQKNAKLATLRDTVYKSI